MIFLLEVVFKSKFFLVSSQMNILSLFTYFIYEILIIFEIVFRVFKLNNFETSLKTIEYTSKLDPQSASFFVQVKIITK